MFNGRRADFDQLFGQARALWRARADVMSHSLAVELLSKATLLSLFVVILSIRSELVQFNVRELPALLLPLVIVAIAALWLRRINFQINLIALSPVRPPFAAAPLVQQISLQVTAQVERLRAFAQSAPLPRIHFHDSEAVQSIMLFAQRMSHSWLELCVALEMLVCRAHATSLVALDLLTFPLPVSFWRGNPLARAPHTTVLLC